MKKYKHLLNILFLIVLVGLVLVELYAVKSLFFKIHNIETSISYIESKINIVDQKEDKVLIVVEDEVKYAQIKLAHGWRPYYINDYAISFAYRFDTIISEDESAIYIFPKPTVGDETPLPYMIIEILTSTKSLQTLANRNYPKHNRSEATKIQDFEALIIGLPEVSDPFQTCDRTLIDVGDIVFDISLYECLEYGYFNEVVNSFRKNNMYSY